MEAFDDTLVFPHHDTTVNIPLFGVRSPTTGSEFHYTSTVLNLTANADSFAESPQPRLSFGSVPPIERLSIPAAVTESIQGKSHTVYVIEVHSNGSTWQVKRRFREFEALHDQLKEQCGGPELPPLPGKKLFSRMDTEVVSKRQNQLETYLLQILSIPKAAQCDSFVAFLESSPSFAELRLNLTSQMKCLELKVKETLEAVERANEMERAAQEATEEMVKLQRQCKEMGMRLENKVPPVRRLHSNPNATRRADLMLRSHDPDASKQEAELRDLKPRLESKQEAVEELLTKQRGDIKLLREAEAKAARLELEVDSLKTQLVQSKASDSRNQQLLQEAQKSAKSSKQRVQELEQTLTESERTSAEQRKDIASYIETIQSLKLQLRKGPQTPTAAAASSAAPPQFPQYSSGTVSSLPSAQSADASAGAAATQAGGGFASGAAAFASGRVRTGGPVL